jgi:hypothetical protein
MTTTTTTLSSRVTFRDAAGHRRQRHGHRRRLSTHRTVTVVVARAGKTRTMKSSSQNAMVDFLPGTLMSRLVNPRAATIDWRALIALADKVNDSSQDLKTQPTLGLIRGELKMAGGREDVLAERAQGYKEYVLQRTLGMKAALTLATNVATKDPKRRCAIGRALADPRNERSLFALFAKRATGEGVDVFVDGLAEDLVEIDRELSADDLATTKNWYGADVGQTHFDYVENQVDKAIERATRAVADGAAAGAVTVVPLLVPSVDTPKLAGDAINNSSRSHGASSRDGAADSTTGGPSDGDDDGDDFMFGKKSKKKSKAKKSSASTAAGALVMDPSTMLPQFAADALKQMTAKFGSSEPAFPEVEAWGQSTSSEASAAVLALIARTPSNCAIILPSALLKATLTFDNAVANSRGAKAFAVEEVAESDWRANNPDVSAALWISFDPNPIEGDWRAPHFARALENCQANGDEQPLIPIVLASVALIAEAPSCDAIEGPPGAVATAAGASARAHGRVACASPASATSQPPSTLKV